MWGPLGSCVTERSTQKTAETAGSAPVHSHLSLTRAQPEVAWCSDSGAEGDFTYQNPRNLIKGHFPHEWITPGPYKPVSKGWCLEFQRSYSDAASGDGQTLGKPSHLAWCTHWQNKSLPFQGGRQRLTPKIVLQFPCVLCPCTHLHLCLKNE